MKRLLLFALMFQWSMFNGQCLLAYNHVRLVINDGISNQLLKQQMEQAVSVVMTEINRSYEQNQNQLFFPVTYMQRGAQAELNQLWQNDRMRCMEEEIVKRVLTTRQGYQVRGIPLIVNSAQGGEELGYQEAVVNFDEQGVITSFYYTINPELYSQLRIDQTSNPKYEVSDIKDRMMILDYVEHFRTSYNQKDLKFLKQVFSDDALIITGKVIMVRKSELVPSGRKVKYTVQTKQEYLNNLARAFKNNSYIKVSFDNVLIVEHPTIKGIYGVTVHQKWNSAHYSDEGYVFMMWDFRNPDTPQIHVRTWQPDYIDKERGQRLNPNDVFTLGDFDL